jgi:glycosyltransferase involved in cell wall biosynthesis
MRILLCHNFYQQPGGEDRVLADERWLLESRGHDVTLYTRHNDEIDAMGRVELARKTFFNEQVYDELRREIRRSTPDLVHCTNIFPLLSPAVYFAARDENVPVVQSLHNYRLICPKATLVRDGKVCEQCIGRRTFWPSIAHRCYRDRRAATAVVAGMLARHRRLGTWNHAVNRYIAPTEFARGKMIEGGLPGEKITMKPNFVREDPQSGTGGGGYAIFVGRLSEEKGVETLLAAWRSLHTSVPLRIIGDGPLAPAVIEATASNPAIRWLGRQSHEQVLDAIGNARMLVFPSTCYETFGLSMIESLAKGTPVIASRLGAMEELIADGRTGLHFTPGDASDLAEKVRRLNRDETLQATMRTAARAEFKSKYTAEQNYEALMEIYGRVLNECRQQTPSRPARDLLEVLR